MVSKSIRFLKTKEEIYSALLNCPIDRADYSYLTLALLNKQPSAYRERIRHASNSFKYVINDDSFRYDCGSGKEFKLSDAKEISAFFKLPNRPNYRVQYEEKTGTQWSVSGDRLTHFNSVDYSSWSFYTFIRSPSPGDGFCNLVSIFYRSRNVARRGSYFEFRQPYDYIWDLENTRPHISTHWTCDYKTACELIGGAPIKHSQYINTHNYAFLKQIKRHNFITNIKNTDWRYVLNETLEWLIIIIMLVIGLGVAIFLVIKLGMLFI